MHAIILDSTTVYDGESLQQLQYKVWKSKIETLPSSYTVLAITYPSQGELILTRITDALTEMPSAYIISRQAATSIIKLLSKDTSQSVMSLMQSVSKT
jgi:hypothetical protein